MPIVLADPSQDLSDTPELWDLDELVRRAKSRTAYLRTAEVTAKRYRALANQPSVLAGDRVLNIRQAEVWEGRFAYCQTVLNRYEALIIVKNNERKARADLEAVASMGESRATEESDHDVEAS